MDSIIELHMAIICACIPCLNAFVKRYPCNTFKKLKSSKFKTQSRSLPTIMELPSTFRHSRIRGPSPDTDIITDDQQRRDSKDETSNGCA